MRSPTSDSAARETDLGTKNVKSRCRWSGVSGGIECGALADLSFAKRVSMRAGSETASRARWRRLASDSHRMER